MFLGSVRWRVHHNVFFAPESGIRYEKNGSFFTVGLSSMKKNGFFHSKPTEIGGFKA